MLFSYSSFQKTRELLSPILCLVFPLVASSKHAHPQVGSKRHVVGHVEIILMKNCQNLTKNSLFGITEYSRGHCPTIFIRRSME